ncbi:VOC family protein [Panacagrimonas sp.]|uniref:VOC family protein n=1 Tax=Panacagrimonas sp. TaxID=2480088 RepID=UPI003B5158B6
MSASVTVTGEASLSNSFLGDTIQVCVVTQELERTLEGFVRMGIGPWRVYTFSPETVRDQTYMGEPARYSMRLALATSGTMMWEVIQPLDGPNIYTDFIESHGEGVHHVGQSCNGLSYDAQFEKFAAAGRKMIQSGTWKGVRYAYFSTEDLIGTTVEIFDFPEGFVFPEPERWYPARPG